MTTPKVKRLTHNWDGQPPRIQAKPYVVHVGEGSDCGFCCQYERETKPRTSKIHCFNNWTLCNRDKPKEGSILAP